MTRGAKVGEARALSDLVRAIPELLDGRPKEMLIDGGWVPALSGRTFTSVNPATGEVLSEVAEGDAEDIDQAVKAARRAFEGPWRRTTPYERQRVILRLAELVDRDFEKLSLLDTLDMGMPLATTLDLRQWRVGRLLYYAALAVSIRGETIENSLPGEIFSYTLREPVGVVGAIIPWNAPLSSAIWKIGPVLATGCTMVLKPAEEAPLTALRLGKLISEAGIPDGVVNIVPGSGDRAGAALAAHPDVDKVAFTGSVQTGQKIVQASAGNLKRLSLELGGKSPNIVFADADLDATVAGAAMAVFYNSGQVCTAGTRLFVERSIHDEFVAKLAAFARCLKIGNGIDLRTQIGPLVSQQQLDRVSGYLALGKREGARVIAGGERAIDGELASGYFVQPTVFTDVTDAMGIAREEIFGPVITVLPFSDIDEVIRRANMTSYGLAAGVWTRDIAIAHRLSKAIRAGTVWVNCYNVMDPAVPFGGYKMSGYGRESGFQHLEEFLHVKAVLVKSA